MRDCLLVGEEVGVSLHGDSEPLGEDVVSSSWSLFHSLDVLLIPIIRDSDANVRLGFYPHSRIRYFLDVVKAVVED